MTKEALDSVESGLSIKNFNIGKYLAEGWTIFRKRILYFMILSIIIGAVNVLSSTLGWYYIIMLPIVFLPLFYAAFYKVTDRTRVSGFLEIDHFFSSIAQATSLTLARFIQNTLQFLLLIPIILLYKPFVMMVSMMIGKVINQELIMIPGIVFVLLLLYFLVAYIFTDQYIIFKGQNYWQAMTSSRQRVNKQWGKIFLLLLILLFIGFVVLALFFFLYLYWMYRENELRGGFFVFLRHFGEFDIDLDGFKNAITFMVSFTYPYTYSVLHSAFADIENLPKEEFIAKSYEEFEIDKN